jgi:outer membrane protein TolC
MRTAGLYLLCGTLLAGAPAAAPLAPSLTLERALELALARSFTVLQQQETLRGRAGRVLAAQGTFDSRLSLTAARTRDRLPLRRDEILSNLLLGLGDKSRYLTDTASYQVGVTKTLETGHSVSGTVGVSRLDDELQERGGVPPQTRASGTLTYRLPLLRNAGRAVATADLRSAEAELEAARFGLVAVLESVVRQTALAYWDLRARTHALALATASEQRITDFLQELRRLIAADQLPAAELELAAADLADRRSARLAAEQDLAAARRELARVMGLGAADLPAALEPAADFTRTAPAAADQLRDEAGLCRLARQFRAELKSIQQSLAAATLLREAAAHQIKPQVDLDFTLGYLGRRDSTPLLGGLAAWQERGAGGFGGVSLSLEVPFRNAAARGLLRERLAAEEAVRVNLREIEHAIDLAIPVAASAVRRTLQQLVDADEAVQRYETALRRETVKRRLGESTVIDVINIETRLFNALLHRIAVQRAHASAIVDLGFELGRLVHPGPDLAQVNLPLILGRGWTESTP